MLMSSPGKPIENNTISSYSLIDDVLSFACCRHGSVLDGQVRASFRNSIPGVVIRIVAIVNCILQCGNIPAILEVPVPGKTSGVTRSVYKGPCSGITRIPTTRVRVNKALTCDCR